MESGRTAVVDRAHVSAADLVIGLDLAGGSVGMALQGVSSIITARAEQVGRWLAGGVAPRMWIAADALDGIARRESGPGSVVHAVVAVPGWFGALDRAAVRALLAVGPHEVHLVSSPAAAALAWCSRERQTGTGQAVLCVDVGHGVSGAVLVVGADGAMEVATSALPPAAGSSPGADARAEVLTALVGHLLRRARAAGVEVVDTALLVSDHSDESLGERWRRMVAAATRPGDVRPDAQVFDRAAAVPAGAALAAGAGGRRGLGGSLPHRLGVLVDDGAAVRVMDLLDAGRSLPVFVDQLFAVDGSAPVLLELVEARRPGAGDDPSDWSRVAVATWSEPLAGIADGSERVTHVVLELSVDSDGVVAIGPAGRWSADVGQGAVDWSTAPESTQGVTTVGEHPRQLAHSSSGEPAASVEGVEQRVPVRPPRPDDAPRAARSLAWQPPAPVAADDLVGPASSELPAPPAAVGHRVHTTGAEGSEELSAAAAAAAAIVRDVLGSMRPAATLDHEALEEIARAEMGAPSLATALVELERQVSKRFGLLIGVRSVPALLDCDDDADLHDLRAGAARLESALEHQPDDTLTEATRAAVRAARRAFADPQGVLFVGGSAESIAADAARVAEHLRLVVGEVVPAERRRIVHDARLRGLSAVSTDRLERELFGDAPRQADEHARAESPLRDAAARVGLGHQGWSIEAHADPHEPILAETRTGLAQVRVLVLERCLGVL